MSTDYVPREGDTVRIELTLTKVSDELVALSHLVATSIDLGKLIAAGKVELVARAEPDWQIGDVGRHVESGELFRYLPDHADDDASPWLICWKYRGRIPNGGYREWYSRESLAGKLERMTLVPEGEAAPTLAAEVHKHFHYCGRGDHDWKCDAPGHLNRTHGNGLTCPEHSS